MIETPYSIRSQDRRGKVRVIDFDRESIESIETTCDLLSEEQETLHSKIRDSLELDEIPPYTRIGVVEVTQERGVMFSPFDDIKQEFGLKN